MTRREFITVALGLASGGVWLAGGCRRRAALPTIPGGSPELIASQAAHRAEFAQAMAAEKLPTGTTFTTPKPDLLPSQTIPELKGLLKLCHRLHPYSVATEPAADQSKLGGQFLWPAVEPWPTVPGTEQPLAAILQLRSEDAPPQFQFFPQTDLVQVFWSPYFADRAPRTELYPKVVWRKRSEVSGELAKNPFAQAALGKLAGQPNSRAGAWIDYVPYPCGLAPERVLELPSWDILPERMKVTVQERLPGGEESYRAHYSVAEGCKVGGYSPYQPEAKPPACPSCGWGMDYLLSITEEEWQTPRWQPSDRPDRPTHRTPTGLRLGPNAAVHLYLCHRCDGWPAGAFA